MKFILPVFVLLLAAPASAQSLYHPHSRYLEAGFMFGGTSYSGDVTEGNFDLEEVNNGYGVFLRYYLTPKFSLKGHMYSGSISGDDRHSKTLRDRKFRFGTSLFEWAAVAEWTPLARERFTNTGEHVINVSPYLYLGAGMTLINPEAEYYGAPDQRDKYMKVTFPEPGIKKALPLFPMGVGIRADFLDRIVLGTEVGWRPVFNDSLDGVSINGNPKSNDWYYFFGATLSFVLSNPNKHEF